MEAIKIPEKIRELRFNKLKLEKEKLTLELSQSKIEADVTLHVIQATDEKGKPLYSNDVARKTAVANILYRDNRYAQHQDEKLPLAEKIKCLDVLLEYEYNMLKLHLAQSCPFATK